MYLHKLAFSVFMYNTRRLAMDIIIACNKQLPIRYYPNDGVWVRRGRQFSDRTLPFFVEIEVTNHVACVCDYIVEIERQYKTFEMEVIIKNEQWQQVLIEHLPHGHHRNGRIYIVK